MLRPDIKVLKTFIDELDGIIIYTKWAYIIEGKCSLYTSIKYKSKEKGEHLLVWTRLLNPRHAAITSWESKSI